MLTLFGIPFPSSATKKCPLDNQPMTWTGEIDQNMIPPKVACHFSHIYVRRDGMKFEHVAWMPC